MTPWKPNHWIYTDIDDGFEPRVHTDKLIVWMTTTLLQMHIAWK